MQKPGSVANIVKSYLFIDIGKLDIFKMWFITGSHAVQVHLAI